MSFNMRMNSGMIPNTMAGYGGGYGGGYGAPAFTSASAFPTVPTSGFVGGSYGAPGGTYGSGVMASSYGAPVGTYGGGIMGSSYGYGGGIMGSSYGTTMAAPMVSSFVGQAPVMSTFGEFVERGPVCSERPISREELYASGRLSEVETYAAPVYAAPTMMMAQPTMMMSAPMISAPMMSMNTLPVAQSVGTVGGWGSMNMATPKYGSPASWYGGNTLPVAQSFGGATGGWGSMRMATPNYGAAGGYGSMYGTSKHVATI